MTPALFIDTNIPIYAAGRQHPYKQLASRVMALVDQRPQDFITDSEVLQEILHYYLMADRWSDGRTTMRTYVEMMRGQIEPVYAEDVVLAAGLADNYPNVEARDLVHTAVMRRLGITRIISADTDFDRIDGIERLDPALLTEWEHSL